MVRGHHFKPDESELSSHQISDLALLDVLNGHALDLGKRFSKLQKAIQMVQHRIDRRASVLAPVRKLLPEILELVFQYYCGIMVHEGHTMDVRPDLVFPIHLDGPSDSHIYPDILSDVCYYWSLVACDTPTIWSTMSLELTDASQLWNWRAVSRIVQNAKKQPLSVHIQSRHLRSELQAPPVLSELISQAVDLEINANLFELIQFVLPMSHAPLRTLRFQGHRFENDPDLPPIHREVISMFRAPCLENLSVPDMEWLDALDVNPLDFLQNITHLRVDSSFQRRYLEELSGLPNLHSLDINCRDFRYLQDEKEVVNVFRSLRELKMTYQSDNSDSLLSSMSAPHLVSFIYDMRGSDHQIFVSAFLKDLESPSTLTSLCLSGDYEDFLHWDSILEKAAFVQVLKVDLRLPWGNDGDDMGHGIVAFMDELFV